MHIRADPQQIAGLVHSLEDRARAAGQKLHLVDHRGILVRVPILPQPGRADSYLGQLDLSLLLGDLIDGVPGDLILGQADPALGADQFPNHVQVALDPFGDLVVAGPKHQVDIACNFRALVASAVDDLLGNLFAQFRLLHDNRQDDEGPTHHDSHHAQAENTNLERHGSSFWYMSVPGVGTQP